MSDILAMLIFIMYFYATIAPKSLGKACKNWIVEFKKGYDK